jgi:hypothetical protein
MNKTPRKLEPNEEGYEELWILRVVGTETKEDGTVVRKAQWFKAEDNLSFGSIIKPKNKDIIRFEYREPMPKFPFSFGKWF